MAVRIRSSASSIFWRSFRVNSHSSNCPSKKMLFVIRWTRLLIREGVGSVRAREAASTESASITIPASLVWGFGPGYRKSFSLIDSTSGFFNEVKRFFQFSNVVIISADPGHQRISRNGFGRRLHQASDNDAVVIGAGSLKDKVLEDGMVHIGQFKQFDIRGVTE